MPIKKKETNKSVETRLSEIEESLEGLLSISIKQMQMFGEAHTAFVKEIARLKEKVSELEKNI